MLVHPMRPPAFSGFLAAAVLLAAVYLSGLWLLGAQTPLLFPAGAVLVLLAVAGLLRLHWRACVRRRLYAVLDAYAEREIRRQRLRAR